MSLFGWRYSRSNFFRAESVNQSFTCCILSLALCLSCLYGGEMSKATNTLLYDSSRVLTVQDLSGIAKGVLTLPGDWVVGPAVDVRQLDTPHIWVHPSPSNSLSMSLGFSKAAGIYFVNIRHRGSAEPMTTEGTPYGNLITAFAMLGGCLRTLLDAPAGAE